MQTIETAAHRPIEATLPPHGVSVLESHHARDFQMEMARHDFFQLLYVLRGEGQLRCPHRDFSLQSGNVALLPPGTIHGVEDSRAAALSIYAVNLAPQFLAGSLVELGEKPRRLRHDSLPVALPDLLRRLLLEQTLQKAGFEAMMSGLALQLLVSLLRAEVSPSLSSPDTRALSSKTRIYSYLQELERTFYRAETVDSAAARLGLSRRRFTTLFREVAGTSWLSYLRELRIQHAKLLLQTSNRTVLAIAFECGFEDVSSFYRAFKSVTEQTPDSWRKSKG
ncbi:MAG: AraC family transcriptional regulator [Armatimonadetes bacterium]|nr:AraC family transcriptional regulator [Armatimonadota bacterium]